MPGKNKKYYVYIILTVTNKLYCGYTDNVEKRYKLHKEGKGAKFTRANKPLKLIYTAEFDNKIDAQKENLIDKNNLEELFSEKLDTSVYIKLKPDNY